MHFWRYSAVTDVGLQRSNNEDSYLSSPDLGLWVVADGMGGHAAGEVASAIAAETIKDEVSKGSNLVKAVQASHRQVLEAAANGKGGQGMGSTVVALQADSESYEIAWVGDSRAYLWSSQPLPGKLQQITTDHSYVQMLYQTGAISESELDSHPERNIITQCLGSIELETVTVDTQKGEWQEGDWILLCSDGLSDAVPEDEISKILSSAKDSKAAADELVSAALAMGGRDNITVTLVEWPQTSYNFLRAFTSSLSKLFK